MRIVHIADIHWRGLVRHKEYKDSFQNFFADIKTKKPDIIYIGGDIVHSKTHGISPEIIENLTWWFKEMSKIAPTHIILGNHDGLILNQDRQDAITPLIEAIDDPNIFLYKKSGVYNFHEGFNWCVLSCFDEHGWQNVVPVPGEINIGLFHGAVARAKTDSDWELDGEITLEELDVFDFSMLGDIHKFQYLDNEKRVAYSGSTIQQNYGESRKKGYILWDIQDKDNYTSEFFEIKNNFPFITLKWEGTVEDTCIPSECNENAKFRIKSGYPLGQKNIKELSKFLKSNYSAREIVFKVDKNNVYAKTETKGLIDIGKNDKKYVKDVVRDYYSNEPFTDQELSDIDVVIDKCFDELKVTNKEELLWSLDKLEFSNLFSYGENNVINLAATSGVTGIFGKNRVGKSSIIGAIMYTLFNGSDRGKIKNEHIVNKRKMWGEGTAYISAGGKRYKATRRTDLKQTKRNEIYSSTFLKIWEIDESDEIIRDISGEQRRDTEAVLRKIVGESDDFLMTSAASQGNMNNFISLSSSARKGIINKFLNVNIFDELYDVARGVSQDTRSLLRKLDARNWVDEGNRIDQDIISNTSKLSHATDRIKYQNERLNDIKSQNPDLSIKYTHKDLNDIERRIENNVETTRLNEDALERSAKGLTDSEELLIKIETSIQEISVTELNEIVKTRSNVEKSIIRFTNTVSVEKKELARMNKSAKILEQVPCGTTFPTCKFIKNSHKDREALDMQENRIKEAKTALGETNKILVELCKRDVDGELDRHRKLVGLQNKVLREKMKHKSDVDRYTNKIDILQLDMTKLGIKKVEINDHLASSDDEQLANVIGNLTVDIEHHERSIISLSKSIGMLENQKQTLVQDEIVFNDLCKKAKIYDALLGAFSKKGIPVFLIKKVLPQINTEIKQTIEPLVGFTVEIEYSQNNELEIYINYGDSRRIIELCSGMEKMMSSLAIRFVLTNLSTLPRSNMLIIDEGFGALDAGNIDACNAFIFSLKKWYKNIIIISHIDIIKDTVDNIMEITRDGIDTKVIF